jgi:hypothetical protein
MAKGSVYFHSNFKFVDGSFGKKYFVVLNDPLSPNEPYIVAKTTTNKHSLTYNIGCNPNYLCFYIPSSNFPIFPKDTIVQFQELFEFSTADMLKGTLKDKIIDFKHDLLYKENKK